MEGRLWKEGMAGSGLQASWITDVEAQAVVQLG